MLGAVNTHRGHTNDEVGGASHPARRHRLWARIERRLIGLGMSVIAWLLERAVLRSARRKAEKTA